jgi:RNA polymerase sigma-70 factor (ECF subfamily)
MPTMSESDLIAGLQRRDSAAFAALFEQQADRIFHLAWHVVGNDQDAEEVVQATFLAVFEEIDRFTPQARISTWMYRIAYNQALMLLRERRPAEALPDDDGPLPVPSSLIDWSLLPEAQALSEEAHAALAAAIVTLPPLYRAAFILRDVEDLSTAECAHVQGISEIACKVRLHRARLMLRERLTSYYGERVTPPLEEPL